jgi:hypothetical protein
MALRHLRYFVAVADTGNLSRARAASPAAGGVPNGRSVLPGEALVPSSAALLQVRRQDQRPLIQALGTATEALFASLHQRLDLPHGPC